LSPDPQSAEFISLLEADKRAPSLATLNKIASLLRKDVGYFLEEKEGAFNILLLFLLPSAGGICPFAHNAEELGSLAC